MSNNYWVYILKCADDTLYTGIAKDAYKRLNQHNLGRGAKYTRSRIPCNLLYLEKSETRSQAQSREYEIKKLTKSQKLSLIKSSNNQIENHLPKKY